MGARSGGGGGGRSGGGGAAGAVGAARTQFLSADAARTKAYKAMNNAIVHEGQHSGDKDAVARSEKARKAWLSASKKFDTAKKNYEKALGRPVKYNVGTGKWK